MNQPNPYQSPTASSPFGRGNPHARRFQFALAAIAVGAISTVPYYNLKNGSDVLVAWIVGAMILGLFRYGKYDAHVGLIVLAAFALLGIVPWHRNDDRDATSLVWFIIVPGLGPGVLVATTYAFVRGLLTLEQLNAWRYLDNEESHHSPTRAA